MLELRAVRAELVPSTRASSGVPATWSPWPAHARERMQRFQGTRATNSGERTGSRPDREEVASTSPGLPHSSPGEPLGLHSRRPPATTFNSAEAWHLGFRGGVT